MANDKLAKEWLGLANIDLIGARALFEMGDKFYALSAFHAQQAAEKALKAYLIFQSIRVPKTHDLGDLVALIELKDKEFSLILKPCLELTDYAVAYRYPDAQKGTLTQFAVTIAIEQADLAMNESLKRIK